MNTRGELLKYLYQISNSNILNFDQKVIEIIYKIFNQDSGIVKTICKVQEKLSGNIFGADMTLVLHHSIIQTIDFIIKESYNKIIQNIKHTYYLEKVFCPITPVVTFIVRTNDIESIQIITRQILAYPKHSYYIFIIPFITFRIKNIFEMEGLPTSNIIELNFIKTIRWEEGLFNMMLLPAYSLRGITSDPYVLYEMKQCIPRGTKMSAFGQNAEKVLKMFEYDKDMNMSVQFRHVIMIDRQEDLIKVLMSQTTYAGTILEMSPNNSINMDMVGDAFYSDNKYEPYHLLGITLNAISKKLKEYNLQIKTEKETSKINEIASYVLKYPPNSLQTHTELISASILPEHNSKPNFLFKYKDCEMSLCSGNDPSEYLDYLFGLKTQIFYSKIEISYSDSILFILRLMCLMTFYGFDTTDISHSFIQEFGYKYLFVIQALQSFGYDKSNKSDLMVNFADRFIKSHQIESRFIRLIKRGVKSGVKISNKDPDMNKIMVFIIGGITPDEIAEIKKAYPDIIIGTTNIITGTQFIKGFIDNNLMDTPLPK